MRLNKSNQTFDRDGKGELLPAKVEVLNPPGKEKLEVWMIPLTLGELNELNASSSYLKDSSTVESEILRAKLIIDGSKLTKNEIRLVPLLVDSGNLSKNILLSYKKLFRLQATCLSKQNPL